MPLKRCPNCAAFINRVGGCPNCGRIGEWRKPKSQILEYEGCYTEIGEKGEYQVKSGMKKIAKLPSAIKSLIVQDNMVFAACEDAHYILKIE